VTPQSIIGAVRQRVANRIFSAQPNRRGSSYAVTVITPIDPDPERMQALRAELAGLKPGQGSPLNGIPDVHFARWVIVDRLHIDWKGAPKKPPKLGSPYLLFSADLTAPGYRADRLPDTFFRDLAERIPDTCNAVWGKCLECPDAGNVNGFVDYLKKSQIDIGLYYVAFPDLTPDEITAVMKIRERFARFAREHQADARLPDGSREAEKAHRRLLDAYLQESATW